ncbi:uncharacterized protein BCR38DRAFT_429833 [Pseudomassariella vexata]|uniref:Nuclear pore assembly and biogenesis-domain-containing protein n=1 Tax=Pseudomassariella vexata TaxID=1141098 RepID=A0A1Y2E459_9PEZI|nr:uncharacterized protein BCR38DRAFT_429833 [Pseudomassariella vexata]ORY66299.1 hypothetical protein BCR38DRAFT_429833 [Pseudomassariella vexata]
MDEQWILHTLEGILPEQTVQLIHDHILHPSAPFQLVKRQVTFGVQQAYTFLYPLIVPLVDRAMQKLNDSPDFVLLGALLTFLAIAVQVTFWVHRIIMFWTRLAMRMVMWGALAVVIAMLWQRGPEAVAKDVVVVVSKAAGYATIIKEIWLREYARYNEQTQNGHRVGGNRSGNVRGW